jgi:hypothetical protein
MMIKTLLFTLIILAMGSKAWAWQLQNLSPEPRIFDEYHKGRVTPYSKTAGAAGGWLSFNNEPSLSVVDRKTGQKVTSPSFRMMAITKEGYLKFR